ncbi:putative polynucleotide adenylyltransferase [Helianthus annuus]|uniref:polynucleotide adenylyltransferase n=1 Tax=Helianthus annuus TaxID=4232 RepID=A0A251T128_HELAN|nr:terminal nucleotidyltransferase 4B isoform X1 [Helianthus annuus]KAF5776975.1 putative polynucleotide adenylyltransferase [Helianthus annuus]KAJ0492149.1 putative polynucleotide adenylyltransferase [Helianthus annuus]KAJ0504445.1 putative polynucleotide adenylyltransferase [Helianthus annuus]KAJ0674161.1 putative polynucleotide adenylyltransferase [Helianthus annuus]KAJ0861815.1 putative polynucleotide adenylyltransferase [Helianthus annuus]
METDGFLYETLSPLSTAVTVASPPTTPPPETTVGDSEDYLVLRNHIPISTISTPLPETSAPDFFSLDPVNDDDGWRTPTPPLKRSRLATPLPDDEPKRSLEAGWFRANCRFKSPMLQLHKEILDFCDFLSPTAEEQVSRNAAVESVSDVIKYIWHDCKIEVFGSFKTGLFLPSSDVDMVILESRMKTPQMGLYALSKALSQRGVAKKIQVIAKARVPIIKFVEKRSGISFDVSFDMENGPKAAEYIQDAISKWPPLRPLCLILKVFLQQRELNEVYSGGIGSYALLAMLIAMLRNSMGTRASPEHNLGVLLVTFFDMYGRKLNTSDVGVACDGGTFFSKKSKGFLNPSRKSLISIQDPQDPENDIGKNSFNYFQIKSAFGMACSTLTDNKLIMSLGPNRSILGTIIRPDKVLLERKGGLNGDVTFTNLLSGAGEPLQNNFGEHEGLFCNWNVDDEEEPLPRGKDVVSDDGVGKESRKKSKKVVKKRAVKVKKAVTIKKRKRTSTDSQS